VSNDRTTVVGRPTPALLEQAASADLAYGDKIGRYLVLGVLGRGGMGVVYAAYDPVLDRKIAVKLLTDVVSDDESQGRARMQREAQALARLSHPNVITVHDVAEYEHAMYIAMEIVEGGTLRDWRESKGWREVLTGYLVAARGLAAAHRSGLVHRDFKPDNVLVGRDGRICVTDFGLARLVGDDVRALAPSLSPASSALASNLTAAGALMGTPTYMAPEQIDGGTVDARTDQFSWCLSLWEALYLEQPFPTANLAVRAAAMKTDPVVAPAKSTVPREVGRVLARGLAAEPADRWADLDALIAELERVTQPPRRIPPLAIGAAALAVGGVVALVIAIAHDPGAAQPSCDAAGDAIDGTWSAARRDTVARGFAGAGVSFGADAGSAFERGVDAWRDRWKTTAVASCRETRESGAQSEAMLDLRSACLERRRGELDALLAAYAHPTRGAVEQAPSLHLPDLDVCDDAAQLAGAEPRPRDPELAARAARIEASLDKLEAELAGVREVDVHGETGSAGSAAAEASTTPLSLDAARAEVGFATVDAIDATATGWHPLIARAWRDVAAALRELGDGKRAREMLLDAASAASAAGDLDELVIDELALADVEARLTSDFERGDGWVSLAAGSLSRLGARPSKQLKLARIRGILASRAGHLRSAEAAFRDALALARGHGDRVDEAELLGDLANAESERDELDAARADLAVALPLARATHGDSHPEVGSLLNSLGVIEYRAGNYTKALDDFQQALAIRAASFGDDSVEYAQTLEALGTTELALDRLDAAFEHCDKAIALLSARLGPNHPDVASALNDVGGAYHRVGLYEREQATAKRTLAIREAALGPDHPDVGQSLVNYAIASKNLGQWADVEPSYVRAIAIFVKSYGDDDPTTAIARLNYAEALRVEGKLDPSGVQYEKARAALVASLGADHPILAHVWNGEGQLELARGHLDKARALLETAVAMRAKDPGDATALAESRFALAKALPASDHARALELAKQARDVFAASGRPFAKQAADIAAWLARAG
jgi:tetratricopeptide (TPR) repeat protein